MKLLANEVHIEGLTVILAKNCTNKNYNINGYAILFVQYLKKGRNKKLKKILKEIYQM